MHSVSVSLNQTAMEVRADWLIGLQSRQEAARPTYKMKLRDITKSQAGVSTGWAIVLREHRLISKEAWMKEI